MIRLSGYSLSDAKEFAMDCNRGQCLQRALASFC
jgi:hypothetical protein